MSEEDAPRIVEKIGSRFGTAPFSFQVAEVENSSGLRHFQLLRRVDEPTGGLVNEWELVTLPREWDEYDTLQELGRVLRAMEKFEDPYYPRETAVKHLEAMRDGIDGWKILSQECGGGHSCLRDDRAAIDRVLALLRGQSTSWNASDIGDLGTATRRGG